MGPKKKGAGTRPALPPYNCCTATYPLVTTGGGALPLPTWAQPAMLRRANTAAVARASFFIGRVSPCHDALNLQVPLKGHLVLKRHSLDLFVLRVLRSIAPLSVCLRVSFRSRKAKTVRTF